MWGLAVVFWLHRFAQCLVVTSRLVQLDLDPVSSAIALSSMRDAMDGLEETELALRSQTSERDVLATTSDALDPDDMDTDEFSPDVAQALLHAQYATAVHRAVAMLEDDNGNVLRGALRKNLPRSAVPETVDVVDV